MTLFKAKKAIDDAAEKFSEKRAETSAAKAAKQAQHFSTSPFGQRLIAENKQLRHQLRRMNALADRIDSLESRADTQDQWNSDCEAEVRKGSPDLFPPTQCPECRNIYPQAVEFFPGMARDDVPEGIDYRLCRNCMQKAIDATGT